LIVSIRSKNLTQQMPKGEKAREQKANAQSAKEAAAAAAAEAAEAAAWGDDKLDKKKAKAADAEREKTEKAAKKAAADAQLKAEEEAASAKKLRGDEKVAARRQAKADDDSEFRDRKTATSLEARNIDDALAALSIAASGGDIPEGLGASSTSLAEAKKLADMADDAHPERRMKASFERFKQNELPLLKEEYPSLKMSQHLEMLKRKWDKSPENPMVIAAKAAQQSASSWKDK